MTQALINLSLYCFYFVSWLNGSAACHCLAAKVVGLLPLRTCLTLLNLLSQVTERLCSSSVSYQSKAELHESYLARLAKNMINCANIMRVSCGKGSHSNLADNLPLGSALYFVPISEFITAGRQPGLKHKMQYLPQSFQTQNSFVIHLTHGVYHLILARLVEN